LCCGGGWWSYVAEAMKEPFTKSAFTLVELLVVLFAIGFLALMFLPKTGQSPSGMRRSQCVNNQKQLSLGFTVWKNDHNGKFPWQVSVTNDGTMEFVASGQASPQFKAELDEFAYLDQAKEFKIFVCPADKIRHAATNGATFSDANTSYFINVDTDANQADTILMGDREMEANGKPVQPGLFKFAKGDAMNWNFELHRGHGLDWTYGPPTGVLSFVDGRAKLVRGPELTSVFENQSSTTNRFAVP
jgi:competence protein ComGC